MSGITVLTSLLLYRVLLRDRQCDISLRYSIANAVTGIVSLLIVIMSPSPTISIIIRRCFCTMLCFIPLRPFNLCCVVFDCNDVLGWAVLSCSHVIMRSSGAVLGFCQHVMCCGSWLIPLLLPRTQTSSDTRTYMHITRTINYITSRDNTSFHVIHTHTYIT